MFDRLFSPITIRGLELPNRVVMSAMGTHESAASEDGKSVTQKLIDFHVTRAKGGCGLNTTEVCSVDAASSPRGFLSIAEDKFVPGLTELCDAVHEAGGHIAVQLWQGALAVGSDPTAQMLVPSDMPISPEFTLPGITVERIHEVIDAYGAAAARAVIAGFDAVEFHCAHTYLPHSFLSGGINHRGDEWGGSLENRMRFPLACIDAIRANIPDGMPLLMRIGWQDDYLEGGLTPEEVIEFCRRAGEHGVDVLNVSRGNILSPALIYETPPVDLPNGFNVEPAARIRRETGMLTMPCGRINRPELAEQILDEDKADLVVMARAQLADADFCIKAREGRLASIKYCVGCDQGCYDYFYRALSDPEIEHITCLRNPALFEERAMALEPVAEPRRVLVAGGGIAGIEAAEDLVKRGCTPILCEASDRLGGQFALAGVAPRKGDFAYACDMAIQNLEDLCVDIRLNTPVTPELIDEVAPDAVIVATGSASVVPDIPGADGDGVIDARDVLSGAELPEGDVAIIGGGLVGIEVAEHLASQGRASTVIEMRDAILVEMGEMRKTATQMSLAQEPITVLTNARCTSIADGSVTVEVDGAEKNVPADVVVMAVGSCPRPTDDLRAACEGRGIPCAVVGDAREAPRLALDAIREAYQAVLDMA